MSELDTVLIYAINRTDRWWQHIGKHLGARRHVVVTDIRGAGDCDVVDDFNAEYRRQIALPVPSTIVLSKEEVRDVIARCRLLRWLPVRQAESMVAAMEYAFTKVLDKVQPVIVLSFPIDRYVSDVLDRVAKRRGILYVELTASLISGMSMLMYRGQLIETGDAPPASEIEAHVRTIANPGFLPSYVKREARYSMLRWLYVFAYFRVRGWAFKVISWIKRDLRNLHYLDAQAFLGHKPRLRDLGILGRIDWNWRDELKSFPKERRVFFGLQLFPEASIDYWLANVRLIDYEDLLVRAAKAFSDAGYLILVKDHPLQFGFRQRELIDRLKALSNVVFLPYEVSGNEAVSLVSVNFTLTGTLGLQSALLGLKSVVTPTYYVTADDFVLFHQPEDIEHLPQRLAKAAMPDPQALQERQMRIISHLLRGSFAGDFFSFKGFREAAPDPAVSKLARELGTRLAVVVRKARAISPGE